MTNPTAGPDRPWAGEPAAGVVQTLFGEHAADLLGYARRISPEDPGQAEDLVQETFLRAWRHRERLAVHANARAWLFQVARNLAVDRHRRRAARPAAAAQHSPSALRRARGDREADRGGGPGHLS
ncbi:sigma-70 family RNA polymerase sigma factor, partial [Frankia sp. AgKG'84/4]|uniref:sigma-70 family RNA polymerase sigma factor n=1 Tax=Frankia sp. AgKG'84/4 TaxID=573490 RepID=UPI00202A2A9E